MPSESFLDPFTEEEVEATTSWEPLANDDFEDLIQDAPQMAPLQKTEKRKKPLDTSALSKEEVL